ncbi:hypothetical protein AB0N65_08820 [Paenarthrobacter sp. NPDC089322]|uniref:hypothetical protein n=1 Tax=Paenarthrobacter sp. NPDC089322 TaxID=3155065 RepID=UPI0034411053
MNKNALRGFAVSGLLVMGLTACGGSGASTKAASAPASETATPTPTPTPVKDYTVDELTAIMVQLRDDNGLQLAVMSMADMAGTAQQSKAMFEGAAIEPAQCRELVLASLFPIENVKGVVGTSVDVAAGSSTALSLASGLDQDRLEADFAKQDQISECSSMAMTMGETKVTMEMRPVEVSLAAPVSMALRTDSSFADGRKQSMIMVRGLKDGVLINALANGGKTEQEAVARAADLVNQAVELIK